MRWKSILVPWMAAQCTVLLAAAPVTVVAPEGYRLDEYRAPVPASVPGAQTIDTSLALTLHESGMALFLDVLPAQRRPEGFPETGLWLPKPRLNIPGSLWLPGVGHGALSEALELYLEANLEQATAGDREHKIVVYCLADCWMSWNAAKRIAAAGYANVYWYPDGTDGWARAGLPLERSAPAQPQP